MKHEKEGSNEGREEWRKNEEREGRKDEEKVRRMEVMIIQHLTIDRVAEPAPSLA